MNSKLKDLIQLLDAANPFKAITSIFTGDEHSIISAKGKKLLIESRKKGFKVI